MRPTEVESFGFGRIRHSLVTRLKHGVVALSQARPVKRESCNCLCKRLRNFPQHRQMAASVRMSRGLSPAGVGAFRRALQLSSPFAPSARGLQIFCHFLAGSRTGSVVSKRPLCCPAPRSTVEPSQRFHRVKTIRLLPGRLRRHRHTPSQFCSGTKPLPHRSRWRVLAEQQHGGSLRRQQRIQRQDAGGRRLHLRRSALRRSRPRSAQVVLLGWRTVDIGRASAGCTCTCSCSCIRHLHHADEGAHRSRWPLHADGDDKRRVWAGHADGDQGAGRRDLHLRRPAVR